MESSTYTDKKFIAASRNWVNVAAHTESGHEVDALIQGKRVTVCEHYWNIPCKAHATCYQQARNKFDGISGVPATVFTSPEGKELDRAVGGKSASEMINTMDDVYAKIPGEKLGAVEWRMANKLVEEGDAAFEKGEWKKSVEAFTKITRLPKKALKEMATPGLEKLETKGRELIEDANNKIGEPEEKRKLLRKVAEEFKPLSCSKEAAAALKAMPPPEKK